MGTIISILNKAGEIFCQHGMTMLVQFGLLTSLLFLADFAIRRRVKASLRYCLWSLVLIKLVLPTTLSLPTGIGDLTGINFSVQLTQVELPKPQIQTVYAPTTSTPAQTGSEFARPIKSQQDIAESPVSKTAESPALIETTPLDWQGGIFIAWLFGVLALLAGFIRRIASIKKLINQSKPASERLVDMVHTCQERIGVKGIVELRLSNDMVSPAVCGLFRHVIIVPTGLLEKMDRSKLAMVLMHELSHVKRADLWVNLIQTILQIFYFYNPFVWAANAYVRRVREQAVDEMVLTRLNGEVASYSNTLIDVAEKAFSRPQFRLATVSIIESKSKLKERIKIMLSKPIPKDTKIGFAGLALIIVFAAVLLPMAKGVKAGGQTMDEQSRGEEIIKRMAEVNHYWLISPPSQTKNYSYEFALYHGETKTFKVPEPSSADRAIRQGITYDSLLHKLAKEPFAATYTSIEEVNGIIRTDFKLKESIQIHVGNGLRGRWYGSFDQRVEGGTFWIDAKKMFPVRAKCDEVYEYFSDYAAVDETHYVPLRVKIDENDMHMHFDWTFKLHKPGLWLFDQSRYVYSEKGQEPIIAASISNVRVNEDSSSGSDSVQGEAAAHADSSPPIVVRTTPVTFANEVSSDLNNLTVTFNQQMMDKSWSWVQWDAPYPETTGQAYYDNERKTCSLPVKLKAGQAYLVAFNIEPYLGFVNLAGSPAKPYVLVFATKDKDGKPTVIPEELIAKARSVNEGAQKASSGPDKKGSETESAPYTQITNDNIRPAGKKVVGIGPGWQKLERVIGDNYGGSIGGYSDDEQKCGEYFEKVLSWAKPGDTFVIMFALDEEKFHHSQIVPKAYEDLLPRPWLEIKEQINRGEVLELKGKARGLDTIVLAAPTLDRLNELIQSTELLQPFKNR
jgi:bla regulator protein BlaR1